MTTNIYILKLEQSKYYVGKSKNVQARFQEHMQGKGSAWTRKYKPVSIDAIIEDVSPFDEDKQVKIYMSKYGIENVRGGTYITETLTEEQLNSLKAEIWGSNDLCNKCGRKSHFFKDCYAKSDTEGNTIEQPLSKLDLINAIISTTVKAAVSAALKEAFASISELEQRPKKRLIKKQEEEVCYRGKRTGHYEKGCYAKTDIDGKEI